MENLSAYAEEKKLELNLISIKHLEEGAKWAKFLSIVGFVAVGFLVLLAFVMMFVLPGLNSELTNMQGMPNTSVFGGFLGSLVGAFYIVIAVLYFIPVLFLYNFSSKSLMAIREKDTEFLTIALDNFRKHYKFIGILTIVGLAIYAIILIGAFLGGALGAML